MCIFTPCALRGKRLEYAAIARKQAVSALDTPQYCYPQKQIEIFSAVTADRTTLTHRVKVEEQSLHVYSKYSLFRKGYVLRSVEAASPSPDDPHDPSTIHIP